MASTSRFFEICGAAIGDFDRCERLLEAGECCPEHPASEGVFVEYEPLDGFTLG